jgi:hypothetical protein
MLTLPGLIHPRDSLDKRDLLMLLNFELSAYDECAGCRFTAIKPSPRNETGSNWRVAHLQNAGTMTDAAKDIARHVLDEVHEEYNLE